MKRQNNEFLKPVLAGFVFVFVLILCSEARGEILIEKGSVWSYLDDGSDQRTAWRTSLFNDRSWASGPAQLGYGDGDEATVVNYGRKKSKKHITTYFRHIFHLDSTGSIKELNAWLLCDDAAVVYLNGTEIFRFNLPAGKISHDTKALKFLDNEDENKELSFRVDKRFLAAGKNVIAVEIHQYSQGSSDISFDFSLEAITGYIALSPDIRTEKKTSSTSMTITIGFIVLSIILFVPILAVFIHNLNR